VPRILKSPSFYAFLLGAFYGFLIVDRGTGGILPISLTCGTVAAGATWIIGFLWRLKKKSHE